MFNSNIFLFSLLIILMIPCRFFGQSSSKMDQMVSKMEQEFSLSPDQTEQVRGILTETFQKMQSIRHLKQSDRQAFRKQKRPIMQEMESQLMNVLDESQAEQFRAMRANSKNARQRGAAANSSGSISGSINQDNTQRPASADSTQDGMEEPYEEHMESHTPSDQRDDMLAKSLDFLYEGFLMPAVRNRKRKK